MVQQQPLSYQTLPCSCWVTSVINGLLCLHKDKNAIPGFALRLLHSVLTDEGVENSKSTKADWEIVMEAIGERWPRLFGQIGGINKVDYRHG